MSIACQTSNVVDGREKGKRKERAATKATGHPRELSELLSKSLVVNVVRGE